MKIIPQISGPKHASDTERYRQFNVVSDVSKTLHIFPKE